MKLTLLWCWTLLLSLGKLHPFVLVEFVKKLRCVRNIHMLARDVFDVAK